MQGSARRQRRTRWGEEGQAIPVMAAALWLMAGTALLLASIGTAAIERARAQAGADAVALAEAALPGSGVAASHANSVVLQRVQRSDSVEVTVASGGSTATAAAVTAPTTWEGLDPRLQRALSRGEALLGIEIVVVSGLRSRADQERLWADRHRNPYPVARPGTSLHERGLAIDVPLAQANLLAQIQRETGLCQPLPLIDPVHFILCQTTPTR